MSTGAPRRAAASHTAALAGADSTYDAVFRRYGVVRATDMDEMLDIAAGFAEADLRGVDGKLYATATSTCLVMAR